MHDPWQVDESDFPAAADWPTRLRFVVRYAILAPSGHNAQPWLFRVRADGLDVIADRRRGLAVVDPDDRELTISCGAALEFACIALRYFGHAPEVIRFPETRDVDVLARIRIGGSVEVDDATRDLFHAMTLRRTTRVAFEASPIESMVSERIVAAGGEYGAALRLLTEQDDRLRLGELVAQADRVQFADRHFRRELAQWLHSRHGPSHDGLSPGEFGMPDLLAPLDALVVRTFDLGDRAAALDSEIAAGSPAIGILHTPDDTPGAWLDAGRALAVVTLTATASAIRHSYLNQAVEVPELRTRLAAEFGIDGVPQLVLRFGYGPLVAPAVRRPPEEVMVSAAE